MITERDYADDMSDEFKERAQDYDTAERARKRGLRTIPKPGEPGYKENKTND